MGELRVQLHYPLERGACKRRVGQASSRLCASTRRTGLGLGGNSDRLERVMGIEPTSKAWEAFVLPLNYTRLRV
jgi:hypothetical protein